MATPPRREAQKSLIPMEGGDAIFDFLNTSRERSAFRFRAPDHFVGLGPMQMNGGCCGMGKHSLKMKMRDMYDFERAPKSLFRIWNNRPGALSGFKMSHRELVFDFGCVSESI